MAGVDNGAADWGDFKGVIANAGETGEGIAGDEASLRNPSKLIFSKLGLSLNPNPPPLPTLTGTTGGDEADVA
jgi:hypothetical protein